LFCPIKLNNKYYLKPKFDKKPVDMNIRSLLPNGNIPIKIFLLKTIIYSAFFVSLRYSVE